MTYRLSLVSLIAFAVVMAAPFAALAEEGSSNDRGFFGNRSEARKDFRSFNNESGDSELSRRIGNIEAFRERFKGAWEEKRGDLSARLGEFKEEFESLREQLANGEITREEFMAKIKEFGRGYGFTMSKSAITAGADRVTSIAEKMEEVSDRIEVKLTDLENDGVDVSDEEAKLALLNEEIVEAKRLAAKILATVDAVDEDSSREEIKAAHASVREDMNLAKEALKNAREHIREIAELIKNN